MAINVIEQKKQEVATEYLENLKKELGFLKGSIIGMFGDKLKEMMISGESLGDTFDVSKLNFWEKILISLSPSTAEKVFDFIKDKQEKIQLAKTEGELDALRSGIVGGTVTSISSSDNHSAPIAIQGTEQTTPSGATTEAITEKNTEKEKETVTKQTDKSNNIEIAVGVGGGLGLSVLATDKIYKLQEAKKIANNIDLKTPEQFANKMKDQFMSLSRQLEEEAIKNPKLTKFQSKALSKSAKEFEKVATSVDGETLDAVKILGGLNTKLPASMLKNINPSQAKKLLGITLTEDVLAEIKLGKTPAAVEGLSKEVLTVLKNADNLDEAKSMIYVLTKSKGVSGFLKGIRGIAFLDLISTGFDVWVLCEGLDEAEAYKKLNAVRSDTKREHQWVQFGVSIAMTAIGIIGTCAAAGSIVPGLGTAIGIVIGGLGYASSVAIDIYYDKVEFYLQKEADFKKQYRTEIKQAIIQSAGAEEWNLNITERLDASSIEGGSNRAQRNLIPFGLLLSEKEKLTTTEDAWKALLRQEEYKKTSYNLIQSGYATGATEEEYKNTLGEEDSKQYEVQKKAINLVINKRLEYIKWSMYENRTSKDYKEFVAAMKSGMGIKKIEKILADSQTYYDMNQIGTDQYMAGCATIDEYKTKYGAKLKGEDGTMFDIFETMRNDQPYGFLEIYYGVESFESIFENQKKEETDQGKIEKIQKNIDFVKRFYSYKMMGLPIEDQKKLAISLRMIDNKNIETMITTGKFDVVNIYTEESTKRYFTNHGILDRMETRVEVSDTVGQNIIYRIATEIHGYTGSNDMKELIEFFSVGKENATGLYYDNKWIVNNDWAIDKGIDITSFETMTAEDIIKERTRSNNWNALFNVMDPVALLTPGLSGVSVFGFTDQASIIDTPTEGMDDKLNGEYRKRVSRIIYEEKTYTKPEAKKLIEQKVVEYIIKNAQDGGYIELPYYLIIAAKKAKIGDLQKYLFGYKNNKVTACTSKLYLHDNLDFTQTNTAITKEYISGTTENVGENAQKYVDYVDAAKKKFETLITYDVNELDIPKEYLEIYQTKITEWEKVKESMLTLDVEMAKSELQSKYEQYHDYFENTYIAILSLISKFGSTAFSSNDMDSAQYYQQVEYIANQVSSISINEKGVIILPDKLMTDSQKKEYDKVFLNQKIAGKSITELAKSTNNVENAQAIRATKQIVKSILEAEMLLFDIEGNIQNIGHGESAMNRTIQLNKRLESNVGKSTYFDTSQYEIQQEPIDASTIQIKEITQKQEKTVTEVNDVEKIIQSTEPDLVYPGRGLVTFDPETNILTSRGKKIKMDAEKLNITGLNIIFSTLKELVMVANLTNWFTYKYPGVKDFYFGSRMRSGLGYGIYRSESGVDTQIIDLDTIKAKFPSLLDQNNDVKKEFIQYLNTVT